MKNHDKQPRELDGDHKPISRRGFIFKTSMIAGAGGAALSGLTGCGKATAQSGGQGPSGATAQTDAQPINTWNYTVPGPFTSGVPVGIQQQAGNFAQVLDLELKVKANTDRATLRFQLLGDPDPATQVSITLSLNNSAGSLLTTATKVVGDPRAVTPDPAWQMAGATPWVFETNIENFVLSQGLIAQTSSVQINLTLL